MTTRPPVTLVRISGDQATAFAAVHTVDALALLAERFDIGQDADTLPWSALPEAEQFAADTLARNPRRCLMFLGTAVGGEWVAWNVPGPRPAVPAGGAA